MKKQWVVLVLFAAVLTVGCDEKVAPGGSGGGGNGGNGGADANGWTAQVSRQYVEACQREALFQGVHADIGARFCDCTLPLFQKHSITALVDMGSAARRSLVAACFAAHGAAVDAPLLAALDQLFR